MDLKIILCVVGSINLAFSTLCMKDDDFKPEYNVFFGNKYIPCKSIPLSDSINCAKHFSTLFALSPCCGSGSVKCSQEVLTPCVDPQDYMPNTRVTIGNKTSTCVELMTAAVTTEMDCSKLEDVYLIANAAPCCSGTLKCQKTKVNSTPCENDDDFAKEFQPDVLYPVCGIMWSMIEQTQTIKNCSNEEFMDVVVKSGKKCCSGKAWKCHNGSWTSPKEAEESEEGLVTETWHLVLLMLVVFLFTSMVMYLKFAVSSKNPIAPSVVPSSEEKAEIPSE